MPAQRVPIAAARDEAEKIPSEGSLQVRPLVQIVKHDARARRVLYRDDDADTFSIGLIAKVAYSNNNTSVNKLGNLRQKGTLADLKWKACDDNPAALRPPPLLRFGLLSPLFAPLL